MKSWFFAVIAIAAVCSFAAARADTAVENCAQNHPGAKILASPNPNDADLVWGVGVGTGWGFAVYGSVTSGGVIYKYGHVVSSRGTPQPSTVYVIASEWHCIGIQGDIANGALSYRRFTVDVSAVQDSPDFGAIESSLKHQIDIVADCGAKPEILEFFRGRRIALKEMQGDEPGAFVAGKGVYIDAVPQPEEEPVLLHELLHAFHFLLLPNGFQNPDVKQFYDNAVAGRRYPPANKRDQYVLKNPEEFFAVTASLYLWGNVDRQPHTRQNLKDSQPYYYAWLEKLFGVLK